MEISEDHSPVSSKKELPKNHNIETRYKSYERAKDYIAHISRVYDNTLQKSAEYDFSCIESQKFKSKLPQINGKFKLSNYPNVQLSKELLEKINMINAYNNLSELNVMKSKLKHNSHTFHSPKQKKRHYEFDTDSKFSANSSICIKCKSAICTCKISLINLNKDLKVAQSLNFPKVTYQKIKPLALELKKFRYFLIKNNKFSENFNNSFENPKPKSPRKCNLTSLNDYYS